RCSEFRRQALKGRSHVEDPKQHVADSVMTALAALHERTERARLRLLGEQGLGTGDMDQAPGIGA
ncbi:MAG TPA: hypothetical protein VMU36_10190, partial [Spirochaetia bacterium]|nr:hypothetical protein [Spirochaetia bacterium]